jgi:hypothetical protein
MSIFLYAAVGFSITFTIMLFFLGRSVIRRGAKLSEFISESTLLLVLATLIIGSIQLDVVDKTSKSAFLLDLKKTFYNPTNDAIMESLDYGDLKIVERTPPGKRPKDVFTDYEIDEYLINFDYINIFIQQRVLDLKQVDRIFGWYVRMAWKNKAIQDYLKRIRKDEPTVYENFESLAKKLQNFKD